MELEKVSRKEAQEKGLKNFFTGHPCKRGHIDYRSVKNNTCKSCKKVRAKSKILVENENKLKAILSKLKELCIDKELISREEAIKSELKNYFNGKPCSKGHYDGFSVKTQCCRTCLNLKRRLKRNFKKKTSEELHNNKIKITAIWRLNNQQKIKDYTKKYIKEHKKERLANENQRRAIKLLALPKWASLSAIKEFYKNCPKGMHVDHIYPLQGNLICGLHVENNLQYLTPKDNSSKRNKFEPHTIIRTY